MRTTAPHPIPTASPSTRRGSTLVIVVALLGILAFLGFTFYTFAKQERQNAVTFSQGAQTMKAPSIEPDSLFNFALQQIILGPPDIYYQSVLWGGRHSMLANMFGTDGIPWNGEGVNLGQTTAGQPYVDMNYNGSAGDAVDNQALINFVDSPAANPNNWGLSSGSMYWGANKRFRGLASAGFANVNNSLDIPEPDVNYNSPDINSVFLSYDGTAVGLSGSNPTRVIIPSYLRPQYLRSSGAPIAQWFNSASANQVMRPHPGHYCVVFDSSNTPYWPFPRYVGPTEYQALGLRKPFTFGTGTNAYAPVLPNGAFSTGNLGIWNGAPFTGYQNNTSWAAVNNVAQYQYDLDVDTDGDGVLDAILMDLGYPPVRRGDGKLVVPLFAISIRDLNGLLNVNAHGNLAGNLNLSGTSGININTSPTSPTTQLGFRQTGASSYAADNLSKSNLGMAASEVNLQRALTADPVNDAVLLTSEAAKQLSYFLQLFDTSIMSSSTPLPGRSVIELANLEWFFLNVGRPDFSLGYLLSNAGTPANLLNSVTEIVSGRNGETLALQSLVTYPTITAQVTSSPPLTVYSTVPLAGYAYNSATYTSTMQSFPYTGPQLANSYQRFFSSSNTLDLPKPGLSTTWWTGSTPNLPLNFGVTVGFGTYGYSVNSDDQQNFNEGEPAWNTNIRFAQPLDYRGVGQQFQRFGWGADGAPGTAGTDDDGNGVVDDFTEEGWVGTDDTGQVFGKYTELYNRPSSPLYFPTYSGYHSFNTAANPLTAITPSPPATTTGGVLWSDTSQLPLYLDSQSNSALMKNSDWSSLVDDPCETVTDPLVLSPAYLNHLNYLGNQAVVSPPVGIPSGSNFSLNNSIANDAVFGVDELLFLQGGATDAKLTDARSRLADLMPGNLVAAQNAPDIRKRLTTVSSDRREFGLSNAIVGGNGYNQVNASPAVSPLLRSWESTPWFPPYGPGAGGTVNGIACAMQGAPDPYRAELFNYLQQIAATYSNQAGNSATAYSPSFKLNVNRFLFQDGLSNQYGFAQLPQQTSVYDVNATMARQNMARDIYTLLYTFCFVHTDGSGNYDVDYRTVSASQVPTRAQAKEMAQFAINLVDALDTDNIITAFYYDPDLSKNSTTDGAITNHPGWDWSAIVGPDGVAQTSDDYVVYGVERQLLAISEAAAVAVQPNATDVQNTQFDDSQTAATGRTFLYFELQNVTPFNVTLASSTTTFSNATTTANFRVRLTAGNLTTITAYNVISPPQNTQQYNTVYFLPGLDSANFFPTTQTTPPGTGTHTAGTDLQLPSGATFSVASQDGTITGSSSDLRYYNGASSSYKLAVPANTINGATDNTAQPQCNLDLVYNYGDGTAKRYWIQNGSNGTTGLPTSPGAFISSLGGQTSCRLILERSAAAGSNPSPSSINTWSTTTWASVDTTANASPVLSMVKDIAITQIAPGSVSPTMACSYPRNVPLLNGSAQTTPNPNSVNTASQVTFGTTGQSLTIPFQLQPDRDFASLGELLQLPLYGPDMLTTAIGQVDAVGAPGSAPSVSCSEFYAYPAPTSAGGGATALAYYPAIAAARFLRPDNPDYALNHTASIAANPAINTGNRWYRLLSFLEVPNRSHQHQALLGNPPTGAVTFNVTANPLNPTTATFANVGTPGSTFFGAPTYSTLSAPFNLPEYFGWPRTQGQINLNMIRHPQVLSALIDDDQVVKDQRFDPTYAVTPNLDDATGDTTREWWVEFIKSRDSSYNVTAPFAVDPVINSVAAAPYTPVSSTTGGLFVPGTANARPFRPLDTVGPMTNTNTVATYAASGATQDSPLENTIFRSLPIDAVTNLGNGADTTPNESRRLFEIGNSTDHVPSVVNEVNPTGNGNKYPLHPAVRHRLLTKLMNNTTTRSNTFGVYITVQYYEAVQVPYTTAGGAQLIATRIGGQLDDTPVHRGFFVVDRTSAIEQMKTLISNANAVNAVVPGTYPASFPVSTNSFSFQANTNTTGNLNYYAPTFNSTYPTQGYQNGIRWQDLVLYRRTLN